MIPLKKGRGVIIVNVGTPAAMLMSFMKMDITPSIAYGFISTEKVAYLFNSSADPFHFILFVSSGTVNLLHKKIPLCTKQGQRGIHL